MRFVGSYLIQNENSLSGRSAKAVQSRQTNIGWKWEVVVAQLAEWSPTISEDPGSNPVIGNFYLNIYLLLTVCRKDENKEKEAENGPFF